MSQETKERLTEVEQTVMQGLKDFQRATVERIDHLFRSGQERLLVADEVGMGKTMIAKGVIAKFANLRYEEGDDLVKVVYICSNQSIANQNIEELDILKTGYDDVANTRLSMQHLMIKKSEDESKGQYLQLIPLTPTTSFRQTSGLGNVNERFIMFLVLKQMPVFSGIETELEEMMCAGATSSWKYWKDRDESSNRHSNYNYKTLVEKYENYGKRDASDEKDIFRLLENHAELLCQIARYLRSEEENRDKEKSFIMQMRQMFANISVNMLQPDLVIMDEFQRFPFLINDKDPDIKMLTDKFLNSNKENSADKVRVLLLSATPYKLYSTLEELGDTNEDEAYREFSQVMKFLNNDISRYDAFNSVWTEYSTLLKELSADKLDDFKNSKTEAESALYGNMCRTERLSVMGDGDYIDDSSKDKPLSITHSDIQAHIDVSRMLSNTDLNIEFPIDYIKSCPYALSFMHKYETKRKIRNYFDSHKKEVGYAKSKLLWLNKHDIRAYKDIKAVNARLERLKEEIFVTQDTSMLLWMPPCKPYYDFGGVFRNKENYSKILVFSSWEMVPRMIGSLLSYEEERRTIARLIKEKRSEKAKIKVPNYFVKSRYPSPRLIARNYANVGLLYPSMELASLYNPLDFCRRGVTDIREIEKEVAEKIRGLIKSKIPHRDDSSAGEDLRWYHIAPILFDGVDYARQLHDKSIDELIDVITNNPGQLNGLPEDLVDVLTNMAIASPANCLFRAFHSPSMAMTLARKLVNYFNSPEATSVIDLAIRKSDDEGNHWKNTLLYCKQGNFQAMIDEYVHLLTKGKGIADSETEESTKETKKIAEKIETALSLPAATYKIESYDDFELKVTARRNAKDKEEIEKTGSSLRSHFASSFSKSESAETEGIDRKDALRTAFNSPFWPFVLASTSIGQEGLDFHFYCRKIMHWNLPSNPIDLEQREGRINRFKCLAIRQNVVARYGDARISEGSTDIWNDLFVAAEQERKQSQSELIPYWCFGPNQTIKIERILGQYPMSKDEERYDRLIKILSLYRLSMGQPRQEELLSHIVQKFDDVEALKELFIDLSPYSRLK